MRRKAQFFAIYLFVITLIMCALVVMLYYSQKSTVDNSVISPAALINIQDQQKMFELQEEEMIIISAAKAAESETWGTDDFLADFSEIYFNYAMQQEQQQFRDFIFSDLKMGDKVIAKGSFSTEQLQKDFFGQIYSFGFENGILKVSRASLTKSLFLRATRETKINFPVAVEYIWQKEYLLKPEDVGIKTEAK